MCVVCLGDEILLFADVHDAYAFLRAVAKAKNKDSWVSQIVPVKPGEFVYCKEFNQEVKAFRTKEAMTNHAQGEFSWIQVN
jgi:hypothetical protein